MKKIYFAKEANKFIEFTKSLVDSLNLNSSTSLFNKNSLGVNTLRQLYIYNCGLLNSFWQEWNKLCRSYWLLFLYGGRLSYNHPINNLKFVVPNFINKNNIEEDFFSFLLPVDAKYKNKFKNAKRVCSHNEPRWGRVNELSIIGTFYASFYPEINLLLGGLSTYGNAIEHLQIVRNASIHINKDGIVNLKKISSSYAFSNKVNYPTDYIFANELSTGKMAFQFWIDDINALISHIAN